MALETFYEFNGPQSIKIVEKILEIEILCIDLNDKLILSDPCVPYWFYKLSLDDEYTQFIESSKLEFFFSLQSKPISDEFTVVVIDTDDASEICRLHFRNAS